MPASPAPLRGRPSRLRRDNSHILTSFKQGTPDECWTWEGPFRDDACLVPRAVLDGESIHARRAVWVLLRGPLELNQHLRPNCGSALCVNPDHMLPKLTVAAVQRIKAARAAGASRQEIARVHRVTVETVSRITSGAYERESARKSFIARGRRKHPSMGHTPGRSTRFCSACGVLKPLFAVGICQTCHYLYRKGRLEEMIGSLTPPRKLAYAPAEDSIIRNLCGTESLATIAHRLKLLAKSIRSQSSISNRARKLGTDSRNDHGQFTRMEVAKLLDATPSQIRQAELRGQVTAIGEGNFALFTAEDFDVLAAIFPPQPPRPMTATQAAQRLGYTSTHIQHLMQAQVLRGVKRGCRWVVDGEHVEQIAQELLATGKVRNTWDARYYAFVKQKKSRRSERIAS